MTKFCFEVPIAHLHDFDQYQDFMFGLSFLLEAVPYREYFRGKCESGGLVYLDNSYNETQVPATTQELVNLFYWYNPTAIAAPDSDDWSFETVTKAFNDVALRLGARRLLAVYRSDQEWSFFVNRGAQVTAVSYWWINQLKWARPSGSHFLGLESLELLAKYQPPTLDTTRMVKLAMQDMSFEEWVRQEGGRFAHHYTRAEADGHTRLRRAWEYFNARLTDAQLDLAVHNILMLKEYANRPYKGVETGRFPHQEPNQSSGPQTQAIHPTTNGGEAVDTSRSLQPDDGPLADQRGDVDEATPTVSDGMAVEPGVPQTFGVQSDPPHSSEVDQ